MLHAEEVFAGGATDRIEPGRASVYYLSLLDGKKVTSRKRKTTALADGFPELMLDMDVDDDDTESIPKNRKPAGVRAVAGAVASVEVPFQIDDDVGFDEDYGIVADLEALMEQEEAFEEQRARAATVAPTSGVEGESIHSGVAGAALGVPSPGRGVAGAGFGFSPPTRGVTGAVVGAVVDAPGMELVAVVVYYYYYFSYYHDYYYYYC